MNNVLYDNFFQKIIYFIVLGGMSRERGGERDRQRNIGWFPPAYPQLGMEPITLACALIWNQSDDLLVPGSMCNH